ncbi:hypothetical protein JCM19240_5333 [Vibrio maritimus]|uniref:Uncharacterized protein n=1 Tax=Vibrio maritimus TaxID=990268 RepID=A0A090TKM1_9VIBR|nr:hypothetical protein JCM19240_5333 [Vibrio maritimus]
MKQSILVLALVGSGAHAMSLQYDCGNWGDQVLVSMNSDAAQYRGSKGRVQLEKTDASRHIGDNEAIQTTVLFQVDANGSTAILESGVVVPETGKVTILTDGDNFRNEFCRFQTGTVESVDYF